MTDVMCVSAESLRDRHTIAAEDEILEPTDEYNRV